MDEYEITSSTVMLEYYDENKTKVYEFVCIWTIFSSILFLKEFDEYSTIYNWYNQYTFNERGVCYNLVMNIKERIQTPPENYSVKEINDILGRYAVKEENRIQKNKPPE